MNIFVVRLNPDPRKGRPYSKYPSIDEYNQIYENAKSVMDGFHEAVNFLPESGAVKGYLPPKYSTKIRTPEPFILVTITAASAKVNGDQIVGIQAGCKYTGDQERLGGKAIIKELGLTYCYSCPSSLSLLFDTPLGGARSLVIEKGESWGRTPTKKIKRKSTLVKIINMAVKNNCVQASNKKLQRILDVINKGTDEVSIEIDGDSSFDDQVNDLVKKGLVKKAKGNPNPDQREVLSYLYQRDPRVAAYALLVAKGICADCNNPGPFTSKRTNMKYLEVHHIKQLKDGGGDTIDNVVALCPNCHRKRHYG